MLAFVPAGLAPWEVVAFSALCAWTALAVAGAIGATVAYLVTRQPRATGPVYASQPRTEPAVAIPHGAMVPAAG